jgi:ubiquinone/menaquinone biosynthesis C-methylase UbiE
MFVEADAYRLPLADSQFALAWCAQSLLTLERPAAVLAELRRIVVSGGYVAILEEDRLHEALLPWPIDLELAIREAEQRAWQSRNKDYASPARHSQALLQAAGLAPSRRTTYTIDRRSPLGPDDQAFLEH